MIETERLILRPFALSDYRTYVEMTRGEPAGRDTDEGDWGRFQLLAGHWALRGHGAFGVFVKATGRCAGEVGLSRCHRGLGPDFDDADEASWLLTCDHRREGYAFEAAAAAHAWYDAKCGPIRTVCMVEPHNERSLILAAKLGYRAYREEREYRDMRFTLMERNPRA